MSTLLVHVAPDGLALAAAGRDGGVADVRTFRGRDAADVRAAFRTLARPARVLVANAADAAAGRRVAEAAAAWGLVPEVVEAGTAGDVRLAPAIVVGAAVGAERAFAMVAARARAGGRPFVTLVGGAAPAFDAVDAQGRHVLARVVPGPGAMRESLYARTGSLQSLAALAPPAVDGRFGVNTAGAIEQGARIALAALAERTRAELRAATGVEPAAYATGVEADDWAPLARGFEVVPELVLLGLARIAALPPARAAAEAGR